MPPHNQQRNQPATRVEKKKRTLQRWNPQDVVGLYAGVDHGEKPLNIHKDVACFYSPVFKAAFNSQFIEGEEQKYRLEDASPRTVRLLIHWMYHQELDVGKILRNDKSKIDQILVELWVLADKLLVPALQNVVIKELERLRNKYKTTSTRCLPYVYEKTGPGSELRKLFISWCAFNVTSTRFEEKPDHFPHEMLLELAQVLVEKMPDTVKERITDERDMADFEVEEPDEEIK
ncbi:hypothetical protein N431DRAFT_392327 [Stipitochalara longipes BDJ]|nr:hypothetical protein N431DRAFT_392327 [Stipitochalara longipes BDJ]